MKIHFVIEEEADKYRRSIPFYQEKTSIRKLYTQDQLEAAYICGARKVQELYEQQLETVRSQEIEIVKNAELIKAAVNKLVR